MMHWLGLHITDRQALTFELFKKKNSGKIKGWRIAYPKFSNLYPIYWNGESWIWREVKQEEFAVYVSICQAFHYARTTKPRTIPD